MHNRNRPHHPSHQTIPRTRKSTTTPKTQRNTRHHQNSLGENHINHIVEIFTDFHDNKKNAGVVEDKFAYIATLEEIKENDYNLNIPRYVDTYEEEAEIDLAEVQQKIEQLQNELAEVQKQMDEYLKLF